MDDETNIFSWRKAMPFMRKCILTICLLISVKMSFGETLRVGEIIRWRTLEPITAKLPVEKRISSLIYQRMFLYDKTVYDRDHMGLKPQIVDIYAADIIEGKYILDFITNSIGPRDLLYTIDIMNHKQTKYHQPLFCPYWDLSQKWYHYSKKLPSRVGIQMKRGETLSKANFHLVKYNSFGKYINNDLDKNFRVNNDKTKEIINNASTGPYKIEHIEKNYLVLKSRNITGNIEQIRIDIAHENCLIDRLKQPNRNEYSIDIIPDLCIKKVSQFEESHYAGRYKISTPSSNNFWMIGFNYHATCVEDIRNLFHKKNFRQYMGLIIHPKKLFNYSLEMNDEHGFLLCGPLYRRPGLEQIDNYIEFCAATRFIRGVESQDIERYLSFLEKQIKVMQHLKIDSEGGLIFYKRPLEILLLFPMFGIMSSENNRIALTIKERLRAKGIGTKISGIRTLYEWDKRIKNKDFDLILFNGFYDYSYDITDYFE